MKALKHIALSITLLWSVTACASGNDNLKAFPAAEKGQLRYVLNLPEAADESALKVEIIVGKTELLDSSNRYFYAGRIEAMNIDGWGYTRYVVKTLGPMAGTLMAPDPAAPKVERFITLGGEPYLIRYNSKLPVVVTVPEGVDVKYRVWQAGEVQKIKKDKNP